MIQLYASTVDELRQLISEYDADALFRGQFDRYGTPDAPVISTSFERRGCIPPLMLQWAHYARFILTALIGPQGPNSQVSLEFSQAILQHYGWRSFYLDVTEDPFVAAWFAAHTFSEKRTIEMSEDCFEAGVFLSKRKSRYDYREDGKGHLYVLSKEALGRAGIDCHDLSRIKLQNCRPRFFVQNAWLAGPLHGNLPISTILASITAPRSVFKEFAAERGFNETGILFPGPTDDPVLDALLSLPWDKLSTKGGTQTSSLELFSRTLEFPEYQDSFSTRLLPYVAIYKGERASEWINDPSLMFYDVPAHTLFGSADISRCSFPNILQIVQEKRRVILEAPILVRMPENLRSEQYIKGLALELCDDLVAVADFTVDHPGLRMSGFGINRGWHYRVGADGIWKRELTMEDCPCNKSWRHEHHLYSLTIIEDLFASQFARRTAL